MVDTVTLPDVEMLVCDWLRAALPADVSVGTTLVGWQAGDAHVQVRRTGGTIRYGWLDQAEISIDARHATRDAAAALAAQVRGHLAVMALEYDPPEAVLSVTAETTGPAWIPDDQQGAYRLVWQISAHPPKEHTMSQSTAELFVAGTSGGHVYMAPVGTAPPVDLAAPAAGWVDMGYLSEDGTEVTPGRETESIKVWPLPTSAREVVTDESLEVKFAFAQWNADTLATYFGGTWEGATAKTLTVRPGGSRETAILVEASDDRTYRLLIPRADISGFDATTLKLGEPSVLGMTFKALIDADGDWYSIVTDDEAVTVPVVP